MHSARFPWPADMLALALAYALTGWAALWLAIPPSYASPLYPSAGIALAAVLVHGMRMLPGVALGSLVVHLSIAADRGALGLPSLALSLWLCCAAALQACVGALLVKRVLAPPLELTEPRHVARFFAFGALIACTVSSTLAVGALAITGTVPSDAIAFTWWTWWGGDALGTLIAAPIVLTLIGKPRALWRARRLSVAVPLGLATLLAAMSIRQLADWEGERIRSGFERDASIAGDVLAAQLQHPLHALEAMRGLFVASGEVSRSEFERASRAWLEAPFAPQAIGFSERVSADRIASFEAAVRAEGEPAYHVFERSADGVARAVTDSEAMATRYIEPLERNRAALGLNALATPAARDAMLAAGRSGRAAASAGFRLAQENGEQTGVVLYRALYQGEPRSEDERSSRMRGVVFVALRMDDALSQAAARLPSYLRLCLLDTDPAAVRGFLAGGAGCNDPEAHGLQYASRLDFADRSWQLRVSANEALVPGGGRRNAWLFSVVLLAATAVLGALLLTMSGRRRRVESAVDERTSELQREIGERSRTEGALRESEQRFRNILNHVPLGVVYTDLQGAIKESNPKFRELVGHGAEELHGRTPMEFVHPDDRLEDIELLGRLVRGEISVYRRQMRYVTRDKRILHARSIVSLLRDAQGEPHRVVGVVEDITERLRLEEAEAGRELAEAANRAKTEFLSRMSHELRTPLNAMLGFAQLLELDRQQALSGSQREWVGQIQTAGWHLLEMINDTLDLSRIDAGMLRLDIEPIDLRGAIAASLAMIDAPAKTRGITITQSLSDDASQVNADATRVKQIVTNLLTNAVKYNIDNGRIYLATRLAAGGNVELAVSDTGLGMSAEQLASLFQPFNRLGRERSAQEGTGIGLVISQRLAELMGGSLRARSTEGQGSSFILTLPPASGQETAPGDRRLQELPRADYHQRVVHYIEDNETNAVVMEGILAQRPQVALKVSTTGLEGLSAIRAHPPSLILLDMHLPDIEGLQLLRMLKDDLATATIPVVVVSADAVAARVKAALDAGAEFYLTKPVNVAELLRLVDDLLEHRDTLFGVV